MDAAKKLTLEGSTFCTFLQKKYLNPTIGYTQYIQ